MKLAGKDTLASIAAARPESIAVFERYGMDYCCGGGAQLGSVCRGMGVKPSKVIEEIDRLAETNTSQVFRPAGKSVTEIIAHVLDHHHVFTRRQIERLRPLAAKVCEVHAGNHPELADVVAVFSRLADDLEPHMVREENILFPYILSLDDLSADSWQPPPFGTVSNPVRVMTEEHEVAGRLLSQIRGLTGGHVVPPDGCASYLAFYRGLQELESDLHEHIHLENNVLFPEAERAEAAMRG